MYGMQRLTPWCPPLSARDTAILSSTLLVRFSSPPQQLVASGSSLLSSALLAHLHELPSSRRTIAFGMTSSRDARSIRPRAIGCGCALLTKALTSSAIGGRITFGLTSSRDTRSLRPRATGCGCCSSRLSASTRDGKVLGGRTDRPTSWFCSALSICARMGSPPPPPPPNSSFDFRRIRPMNVVDGVAWTSGGGGAGASQLGGSGSVDGSPLTRSKMSSLEKILVRIPCNMPGLFSLAVTSRDARVFRLFMGPPSGVASRSRLLEAIPMPMSSAISFCSSSDGPAGIAPHATRSWNPQSKRPGDHGYKGFSPSDSSPFFINVTSQGAAAFVMKDSSTTYRSPRRGVRSFYIDPFLGGRDAANTARQPR